MRATETGRSRPARWLALLAVLALTVAACAGETTDTTGTTSGAADTTEATEETTATTEASTDTTAASGESIKLGILAECEGAFGGFNEDVVAGVTWHSSTTLELPAIRRPPPSTGSPTPSPVAARSSWSGSVVVMTRPTGSSRRYGRSSRRTAPRS